MVAAATKRQMPSHLTLRVPQLKKGHRPKSQDSRSESINPTLHSLELAAFPNRCSTTCHERPRLPPTPEDVRRLQAQLTRCLADLWHLTYNQKERTRGLWVFITDLEAESADHPEEIQFVLEVLESDALIETRADTMWVELLDIRLTSKGRKEIEHWITLDQPTESLPLTHQEVYITAIAGNVYGSTFQQNPRLHKQPSQTKEWVMPTKSEILAAQTQRAEFLAALWDLASASVPTEVTAVLAAAHMHLSQNASDFLINTLVQDGLIRGFGGMSITEAAPSMVTMTSQGRDEVQHWVETGTPTSNIPLPTSSITNQTNFHGPVSGSAFIQGGSGNTANVTTNTGSDLPALIKAIRQVMAHPELLEADQDQGEIIVATLESESESETPNPGRIRAALRSLGRWTGSLIERGVSAAVVQEVNELSTNFFQINGGT